MDSLEDLCRARGQLYELIAWCYVLTESGGRGLEQHRAIQRLSSVLDLNHTCGYITLLKTGQKLDGKGSKPCPAQTACLSNRLPTKSQHGADQQVSHSKSSTPKNGIKDSASAEMLASEIDSLDDATQSILSSPDRSKLRLDVGETEPSVEQREADVESEWVLLDCCFGIPLFDALVNQQVCRRVATQGLCNKDRYVFKDTVVVTDFCPHHN